MCFSIGNGNGKLLLIILVKIVQLRILFFFKQMKEIQQLLKFLIENVT